MRVSVCVSITLSVNSPTGQTPQRIFTVDSLKDADLRKDVPFGVSMMNNHIYGSVTMAPGRAVGNCGN